MKNNNFRLLGMSFTLVCDREIPEDTNPYYISPGGYELKDGKQFDFYSSTGWVNPDNRTEVNFSVKEPDEDYSSVLTEEDLKQPFNEFFVFTGEYDEPQVGIKEVKNVCFEVIKNGEVCSIPATKEQMESINAYTKEAYEEFLEDCKLNEPDEEPEYEDR